MSNLYTGPTDLPQFIEKQDFSAQETYFQLMSLILTSWFNSSGFFQPTLTNAEVATLTAMTPQVIVGTHWYNSDLDKMQFMGASNTVQTITST